MKVVKHWLTGRDNETYSFTKLISAIASSAMIYNFVVTQSVDFQGFALGFAGIITAHAVKHYTEKEEAQ